MRWTDAKAERISKSVCQTKCISAMREKRRIGRIERNGRARKGQERVYMKMKREGIDRSEKATEREEK